MMRCPPTALFLLLALATSARALEPAARPVFSLRALGVIGGDADTDLSCYLLGEPGSSTHPLMVDGGSIVPGILKWKEMEGSLKPDASWSERTRVVKEVLRPVRAFLLTHCHLDHVGGFVQKSTLDFLMAGEGRPPLDVVALPETASAVGELLFRPPLWVDFTRLPRDNPAIRLRPVTPADEIAVGPFHVRAVKLHHTIVSAAFLVRHGEDVYAHLGDTGPTQAVWEACRPSLGARRLRAIGIEVSFPARQEALAKETGHLTRSSLLIELNKLVRAVQDPPPASGMSEAQARRLVRALADGLRDVTLVALHLKAECHDEIVAELSVLRSEGLRIVVPVQGGLYEF